ncbi:ABC transporter [Anopheles sinensis]|uniref:ABC transporter n=1 Tax=Anopheles sinensis TaxID=74873 RepID=A0A084WTE5_ANOSI|nr:ABC transporter [Anopheles sinensis]
MEAPSPTSVQQASTVLLRARQMMENTETKAPNVSLIRHRSRHEHVARFSRARTVASSGRVSVARSFSRTSETGAPERDHHSGSRVARRCRGGVCADKCRRVRFRSRTEPLRRDAEVFRPYACRRVQLCVRLVCNRLQSSTKPGSRGRLCTSGLLREMMHSGCNRWIVTRAVISRWEDVRAIPSVMPSWPPQLQAAGERWQPTARAQAGPKIGYCRIASGVRRS